MEKLTKALCKGVLSGDSIIISGKLPKSGEGIPEEKMIYLTGIQAPKCANPLKLNEEENYGWESRNFLRTMIAGKVIQYKIDYTQNDKIIGQVIYEGKNCGLELMEKGLCKLGYLPKNNEKVAKSEYWSNLEKAQEEAKKQNLNIWSNDQSHKRHLKLITDSSFDISKIKDLIKENDYVNGIIEHVFNCSFLSVYIPQLSLYAKMNLRFIAIPNQKEQTLIKQGKAFVERISLHQDIKIHIVAIDDSKNLIGDINCSKGDLSGQILKEGYSKLFLNNNIPSSQDEIRVAQSFMNDAKNSRLRIWKNEPVSEGKSTVSKSEDDELGEVRCIQVHSGDSISVLNKNGENVRIFLSNIKAPAMAKFGSSEQDQPWAFQAKEYLRKLIVGQIIKCVFDYAKTSNKEGSLNKEMKFYTIYFNKDNNKDNNEKCLNVQMIENGYANIATYKIEIGENSKELDNMRHAESIAKEKKVGIYSPKQPKLANYSDLISANKNKKKEFISFLTGLKNCECVVEYCFSGFKLKLRVEKKQCMIPLSLIGVKTFVKDKNNSDLQEKYYLEALNYVNDTILQRDGVCDILAADKVGNYFGHFLFNGKNFGTELIKKGLAVVNEQNMNPNSYINEFRNAEKEAQKNKVGIWSKEGLANILKHSEGMSSSNNSRKFEEVNKDIKLRVTECQDFHNFYINLLPNDTLKIIDKVLKEYDENIEKRVQLELPIKPGTLCAARYPEDDRFYRAIIKRHTKDDKYEVEFIDYGNIELLVQNDLIKLDSKILSYEPQCLFCEMAYLKYSRNSMKKIMNKYPNFIDIDKELNGKIIYTYNNGETDKKGIIIYKNKTDIDSSYHADLLKIGYAKLDRKKTLPEYLKDLDNCEDTARNGELGLWAENEECDYDQEDDDE